MARLTKGQKDEMAKLYRDGMKQSDIAVRFGVSQPRVSQIRISGKVCRRVVKKLYEGSTPATRLDRKFLRLVRHMDL